MAKSLSPEQIEERRANLAYIRENVLGEVFGDHTFTTTLIMQEEWLATADKLQAELKGLRELAWNWLDFTPNCTADNKCFACGEQWYPRKCADTCPASLLFEATKLARDTSIIWLELSDELETAQRERDELQRDSHILNGLRTRQCLRGTGGLALECQDCYEGIAEYCAPCYLRATHLTPEMREGIREGVKAVKEGRITPLDDFCLVCGRDMPCELNTNKDNDPNWPGSPCTFDSLIGEAAEEYEDEAEVFTLERQLEESRAEVSRLMWCQDLAAGLERERDEARGELSQVQVELDLLKMERAAERAKETVLIPSFTVEIECEKAGQSHVWVRMGTASSTRPVEIVWGPMRCMRCSATPPEDMEYEVVEEAVRLKPMHLNPVVPTHEHTHVHDGAGRLEHGHYHASGHHSKDGGGQHGPD